MKKLVTYLIFFFCVFTNAQRAEEIHEKAEEINKYKTEWRVTIEKEIYQLKRLHLEVNALKTEVANLKKDIATLQKGKDITGLIQALGIEILKVEDLPTNLQIDELGVAFVTSEDKSVSLALFINNQWKIISL